MDLSEMTFGVEIETTIPAGAVAVGAYRQPAAAAGLPEGWVAKPDGSIRASRGREGCEFVSPILRGAEGLRSLAAAVAAINRLGGRVNRSCGLHVHVGYVRDQAVLERLTTLVANYETAIYASTGTHSRERGTYCRPVQRYGSHGPAIEQAGRDRYHLLNLTNILGTGHGMPTVEFRAFAGTLNLVKIVGYVRLSLGLAQRAAGASRKTNWTAAVPVPTSPIHRSGVGQTELTRLFYQLGWTKGRTNTVYGGIEADGVPAMRTCKRQLMALARKYDGEGN
jgi:hypothetical protein